MQTHQTFWSSRRIRSSECRNFGQTVVMACYSLRAGQSADRIPVGGEIFLHFQTGPGAHPASYTMGTESLSGVKAAGVWRWPPTLHLAPRLKKELHLYSPSGLPWPVLARTLPLPLPGVMTTDVTTVNRNSARFSAIISLWRYRRKWKRIMLSKWQICCEKVLLSIHGNKIIRGKGEQENKRSVW